MRVRFLTVYNVHQQMGTYLPRQMGKTLMGLRGLRMEILALDIISKKYDRHKTMENGDLLLKSSDLQIQLSKFWKPTYKWGSK